MKLFICLYFILTYDLSAQVSRSPAVVGGICDLDIATTKIKKGSELKFTSSIVHPVTVRSSDEGTGCLDLPKNRYPNSLYEENARNEIKILFQKYSDTYSKKCVEHFRHLGLKDSEFSCDTPVITSMKFKDFKCEKQIENGTHKISYSSLVNAEIDYAQTGKRFVEKSVEVVQKEQCARVNECIEQASEKEIPELKKLSAVACKVELTPVSTARAPAIEKDSSFDGNRKPKTESNKENQQKISAESDSVLK